MRKIKLSGRETAVVRCLDAAEGTLGSEIHERTQIPMEDLVDVLNGLLDAGFLETIPPSEKVEHANFATAVFETNPAYTSELRKVTRPR